MLPWIQAILFNSSTKSILRLHEIKINLLSIRILKITKQNHFQKEAMRTFTTIADTGREKEREIDRETERKQKASEFAR